VTIQHVNTYDDVLTEEMLEFLIGLHTEFGTRRQKILQQRVQRQHTWDQGLSPDFIPETKNIRESDWRISPVPHSLLDRRVEITGPPDRKMVINALNSGASVFMADFEDSLSPTWKNVMEGHSNVTDAVHGTITYEHPSKGTYSVNDNSAVLMVRPRGLHLNEKHVKINGENISASLFDFGVCLFLNGKKQSSNSSGPFFYLPKIEHFLEARWWNDVFVWSQKQLGIDSGTIKATVLLETLPAAFQMNEIIYELREHFAGMNCGRWDYIFSYIKTFRNNPKHVLPDRDWVTMERHFMNSYATLVISTCHRRGAHAIGGMAAQIPVRNDEVANALAMKKVRDDKLREVKLGHDGTWVAHPGLVNVAKEIFDEHMPDKNQLSITPDIKWCTQLDLIEPTSGDITFQGLHKNIEIGILYLAAWIGGNGCVPLYNLMEDAATAEISRAQVWHWKKHACKLSCGRLIDEHLIASSIDKITSELVENNLENKDNIERASNIFSELCLSKELTEFLTLPAYELL